MALAHNMAGHSLPLAGSTPTARFTSRCSRSVAARALVQPSIAVSSPFSKDAEHLSTWAPDSWRQKEALQQPNYPDAAVLDAAIDRIDAMPPLVFAGECRILQTRLAKAATGEAFVLFGTLHRMLRKHALSLPLATAEPEFRARSECSASLAYTGLPDQNLQWAYSPDIHEERFAASKWPGWG